MCLSKDEGVLGFPNLTTWNKALLSKIIWNIQAKTDSLWVRWIHSEIFDGRNFWSAHVEAKDPGLLRGLYKIRDEVVGACSGDLPKATRMVEAWYHGKGVADT